MVKPRTFVARAAVVFCGLWLAACTSATPAADDAGTDAGGAAPLGYGRISLYSADIQARDGIRLVTSMALAWFSRTDEGRSTCTINTSGSCYWNSPPCGPSEQPSNTRPHAGTLTVTGGKRAITLEPGPIGEYNPYHDSMKDLWDGGEELTVTTVGDQAPAWRQTLTAPHRVTVTSPALSAEGMITVARKTAFQMTWSNGGAGVFRLAFSQFPEGADPRVVTCEFPARAGKGTVPAEALQRFLPGPGAINAQGESSAATVRSGWSVQLVAETKPVDATGKVFLGEVKFE